jgi:vacuolar-type H+-ATPase subunit H
MVYSNKFNNFAEDIVFEYRGIFGKNTGNKTCPLVLKGMFNELRRTAVSVNPNPVDTFEVMTRAINKNAEARSKLLEILRNNDRTRVEEAENRMRDILRTMDGRLYEIKNSRLNQDMRMYLRSGNINVTGLINVDLDTYTALSNTINKNVEIRKELLEILRNNDQARVKQARERVRSILRAADPRFNKVNSNALNADVLRYLQSGNINAAQLKSTNVRMN